MSDDRKTRRSTKGPTRREQDGAAADRDVGHALRTVYSKTVSEDIPAELLDLLGKLS